MSRPNSSAASEHDGARQRVAERWGDQQLTSELARIHWMGSPVVRRYLNRLASGRPQIDWLTALAPRVLRGSDLQVLVVGAGEGWLERSLARRPQIGRIDASDVSAGAVQQAAAAARRAGFDNIHYRVLDLDRDPLPPARYDLVLAHAALHHVEQLEHCFAQLASTLRPGGLLVYNEYVGPDRFQFSEAQMAVINDVMVRLPPRLRRSAVLGEVLPHKTRPTVAEMLAVDPSESVRSSELLPLTERHFTLLERIDYGGTLLQHLLYDIVQNFAADDPFDRATLELLCLLEESLIAGGALPADYAVVVAGKPPLPRWAPPRRKGSSRLGTVSLPLPRDRPAAPCGSRGLQLATVCRHLHRLATGDPATPWRTWVAHHHLAAGRVLLLGPGDPALVADLLARGAAAVDVCPLDGPSAAPEGAVARRWQELPPGGYQLAFTGGLLHSLPAAALEALVAALAPLGVLAAEDWVATPASIRAARALAARFRGSGGWRGRLAEALLRTRRAAWLWRWRRRLLRSRAAVARLRRLEVLVDRPYGGGLVDDLVQRFRFDEADERQATLLELLTYVEQKLLQEGLLAPTHLALLLRKP